MIQSKKILTSIQTSKKILTSIQTSKNQKNILCRTFSNTSVITQHDTYLNGTSTAYYDIMYKKWQEDPKSVHSSWDAYFSSGSFTVPPNIDTANTTTTNTTTTATSIDNKSSSTDIIFRVNSQIRSYRRRGYTGTSIDPLQMNNQTIADESLCYKYHKITDNDLNIQINLNDPNLSNITNIFPNKKTATIKEIYDKLCNIYHKHVGYEFDHILNNEESLWLSQTIEEIVSKPITDDEIKIAQDSLADCYLLESFIRTKYNIKRFGIEGGESISVLLNEYIRNQTDVGVNTFIIGMAHRGRLNVMANIGKKPLEYIFSELNGKSDSELPFTKDKNNVYSISQDYFPGTSDVKYHLSWSQKYKYKNGKDIHVSILPNPSHLETVNPIVLGKTRSKQELRKDIDGNTCMPIIIHGDAAFSGQGICYETLQMHNLKNFKVGGALNIIINNQIGFTTLPEDDRSGPYCTDIGKGFQIPIIHVNSDDIDSLLHIAKIATRYRNKYHKDIIIDFVCYRLFGHNELDQPRFTQPILYKSIEKHENIYTMYTKKLINNNIIDKNFQLNIEDKKNKIIRESFELAKKIDKLDYSTQSTKEQWSHIKGPKEKCAISPTNVPINKQKELGKCILNIPSNILLHRGVQQAYKERINMLDKNIVDWSMAEALAFATQLDEGYPVRISGQDSQRGTFANRLSVLFDQNTGEEYIPQNNISKNQAKFTPVNSLLSEYGVLGYEYGQTLDNPEQQVLWEAQFGDFVNTAQVIIDTYLTSAEFRWRKQSNLVMLLPHGYEGQGPDHSSCRIERFLLSSNDDPEDFVQDDILLRQRIPLQIVNLTTASNYFHVLRRQLKSNFRKPLIIATPKSLLRHPGVAVKQDELNDINGFKPIIPPLQSKIKDYKNIKRHVLCSGKQYYEIEKALEINNLFDKIAVTRIEELTPFPYKQINDIDSKFTNSELVFCQEEPMNMGPWYHVKPRLERAVRKHRGMNPKIRYIGRAPNAVTAAGSTHLHEAEIKIFMNE